MRVAAASQVAAVRFDALAAVLVATKPLSAAFHRYVELPSIALGNRVSRAIAARRGTRPIGSRAAS